LLFATGKRTATIVPAFGQIWKQVKQIIRGPEMNTGSFGLPAYLKIFKDGERLKGIF
jgi:hypothetical protein